MEDKRTLMQTQLAEDVFRYKRVVAEWSTSCGKTNIAVFFIDSLIERNPDASILLFVGETAHKENWRQEFVKFLGEARAFEVWNRLNVECYASMHKYVNTEWTFVCFDEAHHAFSDLRAAYLRTIKAEYILALSATLKKDYMAEMDYIYGKFHHSRITLQKSIDEGFVPEPEIMLIPLTLDTRFYTQEVVMTKGVKAKRKSFKCRWEERWEYMAGNKYPDLELTVSCSEKQKYDWLEEQFEYAKKRYFQNPGNDFMKNQWLRVGAQRKAYLGTLKTKHVQKLIERLKAENKRFLCFCTNIAQAQEIGGQSAVTSKTKNTSRIIKDFNDGKINSLYAVGMLTEGVSLHDIECGILIQLDGADRLFLQKSGRMLRASKPIEYIFYYKDTRDEGFLNKALEKVNNKYVRTYED